MANNKASAAERRQIASFISSGAQGSTAEGDQPKFKDIHALLRKTKRGFGLVKRRNKIQALLQRIEETSFTDAEKAKLMVLTLIREDKEKGRSEDSWLTLKTWAQRSQDDEAETSDSWQTELFNFVINYPKKDRAKDLWRFALTLAIQANNFKNVRRLLAVPGIDINAEYKKYLTPLMAASEAGKARVVKVLLELKDEEDNHLVDINAANEEGTTALMLVAYKGHTQVANALLQQKDEEGKLLVDINVADKDGWTALMCAAKEGHAQAANALLELKDAKDNLLVDINAKDKDCTTALIWAVYKGQTEVVKALLDAPGIDINAAGKNGTTALMLAAQEGHTEIVNALLQQKDAEGNLLVDINAKDKNGRTALMLAAHKGHTEITGILFPKFIEHFNDPFTDDQKKYLTSSQPYFLFTRPDLLTVENAKKHLSIYYKLLGDKGELGENYEKFRDNAMYSAAYLQRFLLDEGQTLDAKTFEITLHETLARVGERHFGYDKQKEKQRGQAHPKTSMQRFHPLLKEKHPFERGFCAGIAMEFSRIFWHPNHKDMTIAQMMTKFQDKHLRLPPDGSSSDPYWKAPVVSRAERFQAEYGLVDFAVKTEITQLSQFSKQFKGDDPQLFQINLSGESGGHAVLMGKKDGDYFIFDSNQSLDENSQCIYRTKEGFEQGLDQLFERYAHLPHRYVKAIDEQFAREHLEPKKHDPLHSKFPRGRSESCKDSPSPSSSPPPSPT